MIAKTRRPAQPDSVRPGKDERRAAILNIAREVFLREGYACASMSRIAALVGGSKATLYSYFPSKHELFLAVAEMESNTSLAQLFDIGDVCADVRESLRVFCRRFVSLVMSDDMVAFDRMIVAESVRFPELGQAAHELGMRRGIDRMAGILSQGMAEGVFRKADPVKAAEFLIVLGAGHMHKLRLWNVVTTVTEDQIMAHAEAAARAFLAVYGNDALAAEARAADR